MAYNLDFTIYIFNIQRKKSQVLLCLQAPTAANIFQEIFETIFWWNMYIGNILKSVFIDLLDYVNEFIVKKLSSAVLHVWHTLFRMPFPVSCIIHFMWTKEILSLFTFLSKRYYTQSFIHTDVFVIFYSFIQNTVSLVLQLDILLRW